MFKSKKTIVLNNPRDVKEFSQIVSKYDFDISIQRGHSKLDAKSPFGELLSLMVCKVKVIASKNDPAFNADIQRFAIA